MKSRLAKAKRFARVRTLQHNLAAVTAMRARQQVEALEASIDKLVSLRDALQPAPGPTNAAMLASSGEIAMRLDQARANVAVSVEGARHRAGLAQDARLAARRQQESADRLTDKARRAIEKQIERKAMAVAPPRKRHPE